MIAKIIKLDEYVTDLIKLNEHDIIATMMNHLDIDNAAATSLNHKLTFSQSQQMVNALLSDELNPEQKEAVTKSICIPIMAVEPVEQVEPFSGIDVAEGYNFRREISNETARDNILDWLEESGIDFLIDNDGNFAVKCPDRKTHYSVNRQFEHILNKFNNGTIGKNVDPTERRKGLSAITNPKNALRDSINETELSDTNFYADTESSAFEILGDLINPSSTSYIEKLDEENTEWLVCDDTSERSFVVNINKGDFEEVRYVSEARKPDSLHNPKHNTQDGEVKPDLPKDELGYPIDPVAKSFIQKFEKLLNAPSDVLKIAISTKSEAQKLNFIIKGSTYQAHDLEDPDVKRSALERYNMYLVPRMKSVLKKRETQDVAEQKKNKSNTPSTPRNIHGERLSNNRRAYGSAGPEGTAKGKKGKLPRNAKHKSFQMDESALGAATGMTGMPAIGINRIRQLAGLSPDMNVSPTVTMNAPSEIISPVAISGNEITEIDEAMLHISEVFNIYKTLNTSDKRELRHNLINTIMDDGDYLGESILDLLLDDKPSLLLEFNNNEVVISDSDKKYLKIVMADISMAICEDINNIDDVSDNASISLARVAYLLESLSEQLDDI